MMNEKDLINLFLENGFQLSKESLKIVKKDPEFFLENVKKIKPRPFIITEKHLQNIIEKKQEVSFEIGKKLKHGKINTEDLNNFYVSHYKKIKENILSRKSIKNMVSIDKISVKNSPFSIVCMVREKKGKILLVEDLSGETNINFHKKEDLEKIELDDVLGFTCIFSGEEIFVEKIYFPTVDIIGETKKTKKNIFLNIFYKNYLDSDNFSIIFDLERKHKKNKDIIVDDQFKTSLYILGETTLLIIPPDQYTKNEIIKIIEQLVVWGKDRIYNMKLEKPPNIIVTNFGEDSFFSHKNTTVISKSDKSGYFRVNLDTREVSNNKINL